MSYHTLFCNISNFKIILKDFLKECRSIVYWIVSLLLFLFFKFAVGTRLFVYWSFYFQLDCSAASIGNPPTYFWMEGCKLKEPAYHCHFCGILRQFMQIYPVYANDLMGTISSFKISCLLWHPTAVYLILLYDYNSTPAPIGCWVGMIFLQWPGIMKLFSALLSCE